MEIWSFDRLVLLVIFFIESTGSFVWLPIHIFVIRTPFLIAFQQSWTRGWVCLPVPFLSAMLRNQSCVLIYFKRRWDAWHTILKYQWTMDNHANNFAGIFLLKVLMFTNTVQPGYPQKGLMWSGSLQIRFFLILKTVKIQL